ncbi:MAG: polysaccharide deacetylase family protein [Chloroflexi bacterium]|nr:polysaccharide deacetylase family protein [Chloroflexota bacterium]
MRNESKILFVVGWIFLAGCQTTESIPLETETPPLFSSPPIFSSLALETPTDAPTPSRELLPTPFITAPAANQSATIPILMYHHLNDLPASASELDQTWTVAPANFAAQIDWLAARGYRTISMAQLVAYLRDHKPLPRHPLVISFDDGWIEGYTVAFPILKRYNLTATFYVYTNALGKSKFLSRDQIKELSRAEMEIQAHTLTHPHLRTLLPDAAMKEIVDSKIFLEKELGKPVTSFAYPFGEYNAVVIEMVKRAGFQSAVTIAPGYLQRADELFTLKRVRVSYRDTLQDFIARLPPESK